MNRFQILSLFCVILGIVFFSIGFFTGEAEGGFFIIFPFIVGSGVFPFLGFIFIFIGILLFMFGFTRNIVPFESDLDTDNYIPKKKTSLKGGGVVLIGPIPIVFGSSWKITLILMIVAIILILVAFFSFRIL